MRHMKIFTIITAILAAISIYKIHSMDDVKKITPDLVKFAKYVKEHNKRYSSPKEYLYRFGIFQQRLREVETQNAQNDALYTTAINKFSDLTKEEFLTKYTGLRLSQAPKNVEYINTLSQTAGIDWRTKGAVNPIKNQGQCGSCWAFSAIAATEAAYAIAGNTLTSFSEQQLVDCSTSQGNHGCNGGWMDYAFTYLKAKGAQTEASYPYTARDGTCKYDAGKSVKAVGGFVDVAHNSATQLQVAANKSVVSIAIDAYGIMQYKSGIFNGSCATALNHGVAVVGYGTEGTTPYWIVRNSWGTGWGDQGYFKLFRQADGQAGVCGMYLACSYATA